MTSIEKAVEALNGLTLTHGFKHGYCPICLQLADYKRGGGALLVEEHEAACGLRVALASLEKAKREYDAMVSTLRFYPEIQASVSKGHPHSAVPFMETETRFRQLRENALALVEGREPEHATVFP